MWAYINRELAAYASLSEYDRLWRGAWSLKDERNKKGSDGKPMNCGNKPLAYAEHYMLARAFVASGDWSYVRLALYVVAAGLVIAYDMGKLTNAMIAPITKTLGARQAEPIRKKLYRLVYQLGECPASDKPPDPTVTAWGLKGAFDGLSTLK